MYLINCSQGSPEWHAARVGCITASNFADCCDEVGGLNSQQKKYVAGVLSGLSEKVSAESAGYKAIPKSDIIANAIAGTLVTDFTSKAKQYAFRLAVERISGAALDEDKFETWEMRRGRELEHDARIAHELRIGEMIEQTGIVKTDDGLFGASVDGFIGAHGQSEYKCFVSPTSLMPILLDGDISDCEYQIQGQLWVTGRKWCDFALYCPALKVIGKELTVFRVDRDDNFIAEMETKLLKFNELVNQYETKLRSK